MSSRPPTTIVATPARKLCTHHLEKRCARLRSRILGTWCSLEGEVWGNGNERGERMEGGGASERDERARVRGRARGYWERPGLART